MTMVNDLTRPSVVAGILNEYGIKPTKGLGQNFLVDHNALMRIIAAADLTGDETCLEIGPGLGTLTRELADRSRQVVTIEKDKKLIPVLAETLSGHSNIELVMGDALEEDIAALLSKHAPPYKAVANLPYYITKPLIMTLLECPLQWQRLVFLVQKEVADRLTAKANTVDYGTLTLAVEYFAEATVVATISPKAFVPAPKVASSVVLLVSRENPDEFFGVASRETFFHTVRIAFQQRRKTLLNALSGGSQPFDRVVVKAAIGEAQLSEGVRGETLDIGEFVRLANALHRLTVES